MAWLTGAIIKKVTRFNPGGDKARLMDRHDGMIEHIAVSNGLSLFTYFNTPGNACSHFYVRKAGPQGEDAGMADFEQYVDTAYRAPANLDGNHRMLSCETQGGVGDDLNAGWTIAQINRLAWIAWQCALIHPYPLQAMHDSKPTSRGIGFHRLGVDPWRVSGSELWSSAYGKTCPGAAREKQIPTIISKAVALQGDDMSAEDVTTINNYTAEVSKQIQKHIDQVLGWDGSVPVADEIKTYTAACTTSVKDYVRQTDNEQQILDAIAELSAAVATLQAAVDALPKAPTP